MRVNVAMVIGLDCNRLEDDIRDWDSGAKAIEEGMNF